MAGFSGPAPRPVEAGFWDYFRALGYKPFAGMRVEHFNSKRRGTVVRLCADDHEFMWIDFDEEDDPMNVIQRRRVKASPPVDFVPSAL